MGVNCSRALTLGYPSSQTCAASLDLTPANFTSAADDSKTKVEQRILTLT